MNRFMLTLCFSILSVASGMSMAAPPSPFGQPASNYVLTFAEEFDNGFNTSIWNDQMWYEDPRPAVNYEVSNGSLKIWPKQVDGKFFDRTIDTDGHFSQTYGFFEIEAKLPIGKGVWPGFWLLDHSTNHRPEIDVFEAYPGGGPLSGWSDSSLHPIAYSATIWRDGGIRASTVTVPTPDLSAAFHKYGVRWDSKKIAFFFDGKQVSSTNIRMNARMYLLISLWFGSASGNPDASTPQEGNALEVNYVRAWQILK